MQEQNITKESKVYVIAIHFARMWGVIETLDSEEKLAKQDFGKYANVLISWAEEYVTEEREDLLAFFLKKISEIK